MALLVIPVVTLRLIVNTWLDQGKNKTKQNKICFTSEQIPKGGRSVRFLIAYKNDTCSSNLMTSHLHLSNDNEYILF